MATFTSLQWPVGAVVGAYIRYSDTGDPGGVPVDVQTANGVGTVVFSGLVGNARYWAADNSTPRNKRSFNADPETNESGGGAGTTLPGGGTAGQVLTIGDDGSTLEWSTPAGGIPAGGVRVADLASDFALPAAKAAADLATQAELDTAVSSLNGVVAGQSILLNTITGNYTAVAADFGKRIQYAGAAAITVTIPSGLGGYTGPSPGPEAGKMFEVSYIGTGGSVTIVQGSGVVLISPNGALAIATTGACASAIAVGTNTYDVSGQLD